MANPINSKGPVVLGNRNCRWALALFFMFATPALAVLPPPSGEELEAQRQMVKEARANADEFLRLDIGPVEERQRDGRIYLNATAVVLESYRSRQGVEVGETLTIVYSGTWEADDKYNEAVKRDKIAGPGFRDSGMVRLKRGMVLNAWLQADTDKSGFMVPAAGAFSFQLRDGDDDF